MENRIPKVPAGPLLDPEPPATAKLLWLALQANPAATPAQLESLTGLSRHTVLNGLSQVKTRITSAKGPQVQVPARLLADRSVGAQAKVLYGVLQAAPGCRGRHGQFTYASLAELTQLSRNTVKQAVADLAAAHWVRVTQRHRLRPVHYSLGSPELRRSWAEAKQAERRLKRAAFAGEAIMKEYLSLLIETDHFIDNARPGWLVNPLSGELLELDRHYYKPNLAFEFNGLQHYVATGQYTRAEAEAQRQRDLIKAGLCLYRGVRLVIVHPEDLSLHGIIRRIDRAVPLRDLAGHEPLVDLLERASIAYLANCPAKAATP